MSERYEILGRLGKGGMSTVYRAMDRVMKREVALKRLSPVEETNLNEVSTGALAREAAALARFQHPNVVTIFAFEEDSEGAFVVMELVEGQDLHSIMKSGALSWEDFLYIAPQCLDPLIAAGELSLLHRDIKPGNIMLTHTASGRFLVKLLDFGLAKFSQQPSIQTLDQRGSFLGSIEFIAPEQLELHPLDQRTDLYSLGCVFYYMLTQGSPFAGGSPAETSTNHLRHRCKPISEIRKDVPPLVADWLMRLISRYPDDRPPNARAAYRDYQDAIKGIPFKAGPSPGGGEDLNAVQITGPPSTRPVPSRPAAAHPPRISLQTGPRFSSKGIQTRSVRTPSHSGQRKAAEASRSIASGRLSSRISAVHRRQTAYPGRPVGKRGVPGRSTDGEWKQIIAIVIGVATLIGLGILLLSR